MSPRLRSFGLSLPLLSLPLSLILVACSSSAEADTETGEAPITEGASSEHACAEIHDGKPHFSYDDMDEKAGPEAWDDLVNSAGAVAYPACDDGTGQQSPIAFPAPAVGSSVSAADFGLGRELAWSAQAKVASLINNGHTWLANIDPSSRNTLLDENTEYRLAQFHFHAPSEHTIGGKSYPLEVHFVHLGPETVKPVNPADAAKQDLAKPFAEVIAVMFEEDARDNPVLARMWPAGKASGRFNVCPQASAQKFDADIDIDALLPSSDDRTYLQYDGSLTTPPCSRKVRFRMMTTPVKASRAQIDTFKEVFHGDNSRPTQDILGGTKITLHQP